MQRLGLQEQRFQYLKGKLEAAHKDRLMALGALSLADTESAMAAPGAKTLQVCICFMREGGGKEGWSG